MIFAAGTGNPFFTTDTAAALRDAEIDAQAILKGRTPESTASTPQIRPRSDGHEYDELSYFEVLQGLK